MPYNAHNITTKHQTEIHVFKFFSCCSALYHVDGSIQCTKIESQTKEISWRKRRRDLNMPDVINRVRYCSYHNNKQFHNNFFRQRTYRASLNRSAIVYSFSIRCLLAWCFFVYYYYQHYYYMRFLGYISNLRYWLNGLNIEYCYTFGVFFTLLHFRC